MEAIRIPVCISPHYEKGKPKGCYLIIRKLFPKGQPITFRDQYVGFSDGVLVITIAHDNCRDTLLKMAVYVPTLKEKPVSWLASVSQYPSGTGLRIYLPGKILQPPQGGKVKAVYTNGILCRDKEIFYIRIPKLNAEVLLEREKLW